MAIESTSPFRGLRYLYTLIRFAVGKKPEHYDAPSWALFVTGRLEPREQAAMAAHLATNCKECRQWVVLLGRIQELGASAVCVEPPEEVLKRAKAIFTTGQLGESITLPRRIARLVYDSFLDPLPAGVRSGVESSDRHLLYRAGNYSLDLRVERERGSHQMILLGQVADHADPTRPLSELPVYLLSGQSMLRRTVSNSLGEFTLQVEPVKKLRLCIPVAGARIELPLSRLTSSK